MADRYNLTYSGEQVNTAIGRGLTSLQPTAQTLSDIQKQIARTNIGAMGALNVYNPNLIINGDFAINQRGASSYTTINTYTVDRRQIENSNATVNVVANGISFVTTTTFRGVRQFIEDKDKLAGKVVTLSLTGTGGAGGVRFSLKKRISGTSSDIAFVDGLVGTTGTITLTTTFPSDLTATDLYVVIYNKTAETSVFNSVKVELGSIATPFVPPLTAEELPKCQRYYWKLNSASAFANIASGIFRDTTKFRALFYTPTVMRTSSTVTINGTLTLLNASVISTTEYASLSFQGNIRVVQITASSAQTAGSYAVVSLDGGSVEFDAEIY